MSNVGYLWTPWAAPPVCPGCYHHACTCPMTATMLLPQELTNTGDAIVGGVHPARLVLEYSGQGMGSNLTVTIAAAAGGTTTWTEADFDATFRVRSDIWVVSPGDKVTLATTNAFARLRWCEVVVY